MSSSKNYYQSIYSRFKDTSIKPELKKVDNTLPLVPFSDSESDSTQDQEYYKFFLNVLESKREAKFLRKIHEEMFEIYVDKLVYVDSDTAKSYSSMISQFLLYSPGVDPKDLDRFRGFKFKLPVEGKLPKNKLKGTSIKYYRCINNFLKCIYTSEYSKLNPEFAKTIKANTKHKDRFPSLAEVFNAYNELMDMEMYEDALIIELIYSLRINPETIALLRFDSVNSDGYMRYFDPNKLKYVDLKLSENLIRDISLLKRVVSKDALKIKQESRYYKDKVETTGEFMISATSTAIYNRFSRGFGGKLEWFKYTPGQIIKLSKLILSFRKEKDNHKSLGIIQDSLEFAELS